MRPLDGDVEEMAVPPLDDRALDALLSGSRSAPAGLDWLVPFVDGLGEAASTPAPVMRPALALLLSEGFSAETADAPAPAVSAPAAFAPRRRLLPKLAAVGLAAKVAMGVGVAAASTTAAGALGVLPGPAQHVVATVVDAATPFTFPDKTENKANFGATVSADATGTSDGVPGVDGKAVSDAARNKGDGTTPSTDAGGGNGVGANTGSKGLDRANETPAAGNVPTSLPANGKPDAPGAPGSNGLGTAATTPAAGKAPTSVPPTTPAAPGGQGAPGRSTVSSTPAADKVPARP
jgi:hypothetical protein